MKPFLKHPSEKKQIGALGEQIAEKWLSQQGFSIISRNYLKKWGEIDIIAASGPRTRRKIHFVEVKTVSYETREKLDQAVSRGTWRPEENVHYQKLMRIRRTIETWLAENDSTAEWQIDIISVRMVPREKFATVKYLDNIIV